jgi:hypothetical protein
VLALLVLQAGPALLVRLLVQVGWSLPAIVALYAIHQGVRAVGLWRSILAGSVRFVEILRIRIVGESLEILTYTGPFLAEPAKGLLLKRCGLPSAIAFAAVATEYLLYTAVSAAMASVAFILLFARGTLPGPTRPAALAIAAIAVAFNVALAFAAITGSGLIVPSVRALGAVIGRSRAAFAAEQIGHVERVLVSFLHDYPARLAEVLGIEVVAHALLASEVWIVLRALRLPFSALDPLLVEGGGKIIAAGFFFIPGQVGASEGVYALLLGAIGFAAATGVTLSLARRIRAALVAGLSLLVLAWWDERLKTDD